MGCKCIQPNINNEDEILLIIVFELLFIFSKMYIFVSFESWFPYMLFT